MSTKSGELSARKLAAFQRAQQRRGVVYISRVPPGMGVEKLRHLMAAYGELDRIYLVAEDAASKRRRVKAGGNRKTRFTEGWIEFLDKRIARQVAESLNATPIGGPKRSHFHDDLWNLKYLPKFKWDHLCEVKAYEARVREAKLRMELAHAKRDTEQFVESVEQGRAIAAMEARHSRGGAAGAAAGASGANGEKKRARPNRTFRQHAPAADPTQVAVERGVLEGIMGGAGAGKRRRKK